jgi:hypothetical protein
MLEWAEREKAKPTPSTHFLLASKWIGDLTLTP